MASQRVLVIDDDPYVLRAVTLCLAPIPNIDIYGAVTGYQGLELADRDTPDLILLDFGLNVSGEEHRANNSNPIASLP